MHRIKLLTAMLLVGVASLAQMAHGQDGWYAGLDVGNSKADAQFSEFLFGSPASDNIDNSTGFRVRFGYQLSKHFAVEIGYVDFGDFDFDFNPGFCPVGVPAPCPFSTRTSMSGLVGDVVGTLPLGEHWSLQGLVGVFRMKVEARAPDDGGNDSASHFGLQAGVGVGYRLNDRWDLLLDWTQFEQLDLGLTLGGGVGAFSSGKTQLTSLGINYRW